MNRSFPRPRKNVEPVYVYPRTNFVAVGASQLSFAAYSLTRLLSPIGLHHPRLCSSLPVKFRRPLSSAFVPAQQLYWFPSDHYRCVPGAVRPPPFVKLHRHHLAATLEPSGHHRIPPVSSDDLRSSTCTIYAFQSNKVWNFTRVDKRMDVIENPRPLVEASVNDQRFLLNFIMGTYLGPDVKTDIPRRSAFQRIAEGLPPYYSSDLGEAFLKLSDVECLYYYVLRNAHPSAVLRVHSLYQYFKGRLPPPVLESLDDDRQFTTLFPPDIHKQGRYKGSFKIFKGIIFFDSPNTSYVSPSDLQRFKWLTGLDDLNIDREEAQLYRHGYRTDRDETQQIPNYAMVMETPKDLPNGNAAAAARRRISNQRRRLRVALQMQLPPPPRTDLANYVPVDSFNEEELPVQSPHPSGPSILFLSSSPSVENWNFDSSIILTGTAKEGRAGPPVGLVDIGTSKDAYLFRIALPGVKKDARQFSCEIEYDGKVVIRGVTSTGESTVMRNSRIFHMKTQHLCPPGPFSISFYLPGPVDPRLFSGNFGSDGILEAIVKKYREPTGTSGKVRL